MAKESNKGTGASYFPAMSNTNMPDAQTYEMGAHQHNCNYVELESFQKHATSVKAFFVVVIKC
jgi:hypothetical protein